VVFDRDGDRVALGPAPAPVGRRALLGLVGIRVPTGGGNSRFFEYVAQIRIHYWLTPDAKRQAGGHRDPIVGRRLPWAGDNYDVLRSLQWQVHAYGGIAATDIPDLGLAVHVFAPSPPFVAGRLYLVRPDGFVAAQATPAEAPSSEISPSAVLDCQEQAHAK